MIVSCLLQAPDYLQRPLDAVTVGNVSAVIDTGSAGTVEGARMNIEYITDPHKAGQLALTLCT